MKLSEQRVQPITLRIIKNFLLFSGKILLRCLRVKHKVTIYDGIQATTMDRKIEQINLHFSAVELIILLLNE
jgi:hypothetical protein